MAKFQDLAIELVSEIFSYLNCNDLSELCLVSRLFNLIAECLMYKSVRLYRPKSRRSRITPLLRTLLNRPTLARHVQLLRLGWGWTVVRDPDSTPQTRQDNTLFSLASNRLGLPQPRWAEEVHAFLLLHILPNLQTLSMNGCGYLRERIECSLTTPVEDLPAGLKSLRIFRDVGDGPVRATPTMLLALMRLPCIRKITSEMHLNYDHTYSTKALSKILSSAEYRGRSTIQNLSFRNGCFLACLLEGILQVPRALTYFSYEGFIHLDTTQTATFRAALRHLRPTLQYLRLGWVYELDGGPPDGDDEESYTIGSLRDWPALRTVDCGLLALVGKAPVARSRLVDVLPRVIRQLKVHQMHDLPECWEYLEEIMQWTVSDVTDQIVELLERREECGLQELVELTVCLRERDAVMETEARLEAACDAASVMGVRVNVEH
ncbi:hypothetical protein Q9L58_009618 [Maublancomyces gigas]|uniref:F-box domain-containing protein n=1 Tax=Discina gigas TaxID=1032678 RepID=A0ABR3G6W0_9PEZI